VHAIQPAPQLQNYVLAAVVIQSLVLVVLIAPIICLAQDTDFAAWAKKNTDGSWTKTTLHAVSESSMSTITPRDIFQFCPTYPNLEPGRRNKFWVGLLSAMARPESDFRPEARFTEAFPDASRRRVISRGLLQISIESANLSRYDCKVAKAEDLHVPEINLGCGVKIMFALVKADGVIATYKTDQRNRGGGRYWSVLQESRGHLSEIFAFTRNLAFCRLP
jgi:hypothetical protein